MAQAELFCRMASAATENEERWATEIAWIASRGFAGVRLDIGFSDANPTGIAYSSSTVNLTFLNTIFDLLILAGLKCQLQVGGDAPPTTTGWRALAGLSGSGAWPHAKRPPKGSGNAVPNQTAAYKSAAIALMYEKYEKSGQDPRKCRSVELWNEPGRGGAGAPPANDDYWLAGTTDFAMGTWDSPTSFNPAPPSGEYTTIVEYLNIELPQIDFKNLPLISPSFASLVLDQVTNGLERELETCLADGDDWLEVFFASPEPTWGISCYYTQDGAEIALGPALFARRAVYGRDNRVADSSDVNAIASRFALMKAELPMTNGVGFTICEAGVSPIHADMTESENRLRRLNYEELGRYRLAYLDALRALKIARVCFYTASDTSSTDPEDRFGIFNDDVGTGSDQTYTADIPFAQRAGLSGLVPFAGANYVMAEGEVLPPGLQ